ncbi:MAG: hypothetical protein B6242_03310 [Anaerolineaceae bacterium 4572_78]|nr:MAG: hypothetical protein B6242_03310 [Anaerolineaceae bacterium 4572_78]
MSTRISDPLLSYQFMISVSFMKGIARLKGYFVEFSGIGDENEVVDYRAIDARMGRARPVLARVPGLWKPQEITLKRGVTSDLGLWEWRILVRLGTMGLARANMSVTLFNRHYEEMVRWDFRGAWPSKLSGPKMATDSNDFAVEEITIVYETANKSLIGGSLLDQLASIAGAAI